MIETPETRGAWIEGYISGQWDCREEHDAVTSRAVWIALVSVGALSIVASWLARRARR